MRIDVRLTGLQQLRAQLAGVSDRRLAAIAATGLTRTAKRASTLWQERIDTNVENPMAFTRKAVRIEPARANKLSAKVAVKCSSAAVRARFAVGDMVRSRKARLRLVKRSKRLVG